MTKITVALLQMVSHRNDQDKNMAKGEAFCRRAAGLGADIALFPEMWSIGYTYYDPSQPGARQVWAAQAIARDSAFVRHFRALSRELNMAIALTYLEQWPGAPRNAVSLIDRHGEILMTYAKVHTCEWGTEGSCTPGDDFYVCTLDTVSGEVRIGAMICYDREFPESARILMLKGAELILTPNACGLEQHRIGQFKARAYENMVGVAMTNYAAPQENGHSVAFDPVISAGEEESRDTLIVEAGREEGIYVAPFDMDQIRAWREREVWGNTYRRPGRYGMLTSTQVEPPFIRADATR